MRTLFTCICTSIFVKLIGDVNNIPTMHFWSEIPRITQSKSSMLSLTECSREFQMMHCGILCNMPFAWGIMIDSGLYFSLHRLRCLREFLHLHRNKKKADHCQKSTVSSNLFYPLTRLHYQLEFSLHLYLDISA